MDLTTEDMRELSTGNVTGTILAKLEVMNNEDLSVYMTDTNFNKFVNEVARLRPGFPPQLIMDVFKLWVRLVSQILRDQLPVLTLNVDRRWNTDGLDELTSR